METDQSLTEEDFNRIHNLNHQAQNLIRPIDSVFPDDSTRRIFILLLSERLVDEPLVATHGEEVFLQARFSEDTALSLADELEMLEENEMDLLINRYTNHGAVHRLFGDLIIAEAEFWAKGDLEGADASFVAKWKPILARRMGELSVPSGPQSHV